MKHIFAGFLAAILILIINSNSLADEIVTMGVDEWPPMISKDLKHKGVVSRIVEDSFALVGIEVEYRWGPWKRIYHNVVKKKYDLSPGWSKNEERIKEVNYSDPIFEKYLVFFHLKSFPFNWRSFDDLKGIKIGATRGYFYGDELEKFKEQGKIKIEYVNKDAQNLKKILVGRIQIFPLNILTGYSLIQTHLTENEFKQFTHHPKKVSPPSNSYVIFAKNAKNERMMRLFNEGLKKLRKSGKYKQYFEESNRGDYQK